MSQFFTAEDFLLSHSEISCFFAFSRFKSTIARRIIIQERNEKKSNDDIAIRRHATSFELLLGF